VAGLPLTRILLLTGILLLLTRLLAAALLLLAGFLARVLVLLAGLLIGIVHSGISLLKSPEKNPLPPDWLREQRFLRAVLMC
jgi:hypothetical protein